MGWILQTRVGFGDRPLKFPENLRVRAEMVRNRTEDLPGHPSGGDPLSGELLIDAQAIGDLPMASEVIFGVKALQPRSDYIGNVDKLKAGDLAK